MDNLPTNLKISPVGKSLVMCRHPHRAAIGHETTKQDHQARDIVRMQACGRTVDEKDRPLYAATRDPR